MHPSQLKVFDAASDNLLNQSITALTPSTIGGKISLANSANFFPSGSNAACVSLNAFETSSKILPEVSSFHPYVQLHHQDHHVHHLG